MKSTGVVRRLDDLGRVVLPISIRKNMNIDEGTPLEVFVDGDTIILKKYGGQCAICGSNEIDNATRLDNNKLICESCKNKIINGGK